MPSQRVYDLTAFTSEQLFDLHDHLKDSPKRSRISLINMIGFYLSMLRQNSSFARQHAKLPIALSENQMRSAIHEIRKTIHNVFAEKYLGISQIGKDEIIKNHTTSMAKILFEADETALISVWDTTFIYCQHSSNHQIDKELYSQHKKRNLMKVMVVASTDGHIIDAIGPFKPNSSNNDASILKSIMSRNTNSFFESSFDEDIFIVDKGFRDSVEDLEGYGFKVMMPAFLNNQKQHTTAEANSSRLVTSVRK